MVTTALVVFLFLSFLLLFLGDDGFTCFVGFFLTTLALLAMIERFYPAILR